jgi:predicted DNA-binding ribbon-helix-helix protein
MLLSKNVFVRGHRTSMRLEPEMWNALLEIAAVERLTPHELVTRIAAVRGVNLTSAVRCFVISWYVQRCADLSPPQPGARAAPAVSDALASARG